MPPAGGWAIRWAIGPCARAGLVLWLAGAAVILCSSPAIGSEDANPYTRISVVAPPDDTALRSNAGNLRVLAEVLPKLKNGHRLQLLLDGEPQGAPVHRSEFLLENIDRGTHELAVRIVDEAGHTVATGAPNTVHILRHSRLHHAN